MQSSEKINSAQGAAWKNSYRRSLPCWKNSSWKNRWLEKGPATHHELVEEMLHNQQQARFFRKNSPIYILPILPLFWNRCPSINGRRRGSRLKPRMKVRCYWRSPMRCGKRLFQVWRKQEELATVAGQFNTDEIADLAAEPSKNHAEDTPLFEWQRTQGFKCHSVLFG